MLTEYFIKYHSSVVKEILCAPEENLLYSIYINFIDLYDADPENANKILSRPRQYLPLCDNAAVEAQKQLLEPNQSVKKRIRTRITGLPVTIDQGDIGGFVSLTGIIVRMSQPTAVQTQMRYKCRKCKHVTVVNIIWENNMFPETKQCEACKSCKITQVDTLQPEDCADYQEIKLQCPLESICNYAMGFQIILLDDLVDKCRPGERVEISGISIRKWGNIVAGKRAESTIMMLANSICVEQKFSESQSLKTVTDKFQEYWVLHQEKPLVGRDNILASICPQICGMYKLKLALAVILAGGVTKVNAEGTRIRGKPHLLLIGDPGTGKSQIMRTAARLAVRSVHTTGIGSTSAGLTAAAVKDADGWHLEAGALVLADGGICCIDEFATMRSNDLGSVHEAMEQQTISIAKAGLLTTLSSRCTVIAAVNPIGGQIIEGEEINTKLEKPLLSRFDLVIYLKDNKNPEWDKVLSDYILNAACEISEETTIATKRMEDWDLTKMWTEDIIREYLSYIDTLKPVMSAGARTILEKVYLSRRSDPNVPSERKTVRLLDSLIRLAEGHARLMFRSEVLLMDAIVAADLVQNSSVVESIVSSIFPEDPTFDYNHKCKIILKQLELDQLIGTD